MKDIGAVDRTLASHIGGGPKLGVCRAITGAVRGRGRVSATRAIGLAR
jgi:hypothetical protein